MIRRLFKRMLGAQIASVMAVTVCMVIDSIVIGQFLGVEAMAAYGLANPVLLAFTAISCLLATGVQVAASKTVGRGDKEGTDRIYSLGVTLSLGISGVGIVLLACFCSPLCRLLGAETESIFRLSRNYILGFILGIPATFLAQIFIPFMQFGGKWKRLATAVGFMTFTDIAFDLLNVFVFHGGMFGMAIASSLSYYAALLLCFRFFVGKKAMYRYSLRTFRRADCCKVLKNGIPIAVSQSAFCLLVFCVNHILLDKGGSTAVAAYSAINSLSSICYSVGGGIGSVALTLGSIAVLEDDREAMHSTVRTMVMYALALDVLLIGLVLAFARPLTAVFYPDGGPAAEIAKNGLRVFIFTLLFSAQNSAFKNYYQGIGQTLFSEVISFCSSAFTALFAFLLAGRFGVNGVFSAFIWGEAATLLGIAVAVWSINKKVSLSVPAFALSSLTKKSSGPRFTATITEENGIQKTASDIRDFSLSCCGDDQRTPMLLSLCVEEMATNIVHYGFQDGHSHSIDILLFREEGSWVLRIRDDCVNFDPVEYLSERGDEGDPEAHIGIRLVMSLVTRADYKNSLGLNNLTLIL